MFKVNRDGVCFPGSENWAGNLGSHMKGGYHAAHSMTGPARAAAGETAARVARRINSPIGWIGMGVGASVGGATWYNRRKANQQFGGM